MRKTKGRKCEIYGRRENALVKDHFFTLVLRWLMVSPCLLMAIKTMSGKFGSEVC